MRYVAFIVISLVLHAILYSLFERFSVLTMLYSVLWAIMSLVIYTSVSLAAHRLDVQLGISATLIAIGYFLIYFLLIFPGFNELKMHGYILVHSNAITPGGVLYLIIASIAEGLLLLATVFARKALFLLLDRMSS